MSAKRLFAALILALHVLFLCSGSSAQSTAANATLNGVAVDPQGHPVPRATISIKSADFSSVRTVISNSDGHFTAPFLPSGAYLVQAQAPGFEMKKPLRITLSGGGSITVNLQLSVASRTEQVTVSGKGATVEGNTAAPESNLSEAQTGNSFPGLTVTYLPSRNRDFMQFAQLTAGSATTESGVSIAGQRAESTEAAVDGADFNDPLLGGQRGAHDSGSFFPQTVVREFQVVRSGTEAEVGRTNAGFINIVTKEGSTKYRGEFFYIGRLSALSSPDAFGHSLNNAQNQFGGSVGGPIRKDKAFFYAGAEQDYLNVPWWTQFAPSSDLALLAPHIQSTQKQNIEESSPIALFGRADLLLTARNTLNLQANFNRIHASELSEGSTRELAPAGHSSDLSGRSYWLRGSLTTLLHGGAVNQLLAQWARDSRGYSPNDLSPELVISGVAVLGGSSLLPAHSNSQRLQFGDDLALTWRSGLLHIGGQLAYDPFLSQREPFLNARFDFNSISAFNVGVPHRYRQTFITGDPVFRGSERQFGLYASFKFNPVKSLAITAGMRWDAQWNPQPPNPNFALAGTQSVPGDFGQLQPRLGLAWNAEKGLVIRASTGLFDAPTPAITFQRAFTDNGVNAITVDSYFDPELLPLVATGGFHALSTLPVVRNMQTASAFDVDRNFLNPRSFQTSGSAEKQFGSRATLNIGYIHGSTWRLPIEIDHNLFPATVSSTGLPVFPAIRPNPDFGQIFDIVSSAHSSYDAMLLTSTWQLSRRTQVTANYTLSRTRDNQADLGPFSEPLVLNPFDLHGERGYSVLDARHNFNVNAIVNLPWGLKCNPAMLVHSGLPYTAIVGFDQQNDANDMNDRVLLPEGVAPRNIFRQPAFVNLDLRLVKDFTLKGEGHHLDLFMDIFNLTRATNRNFGPDAVSVSGNPAFPVASAGQPLFAPDTTRFGSARQVQFTARLVAF
ncbi:MAG TPA: carboxypeptidase regulatory-like domain-containing protein [Candidatus Limnocylindrales bacterium]|nr:carboxypeptidase regulatory-like domain-containing protein [Candidatus Limnocylindrales bacterium]